jgi:V/A-type H+-transporting ATPase subunit K
LKRTLILTALLAMVVTVAAPVAAFASAGTHGTAQAQTHDPQVTTGDTAQAVSDTTLVTGHAAATDRTAAWGYGLAALAAALAVGLCALGTGYAQAKIGTAGGGALAEKPELSGVMIILVAIPETAVILGFVIAILMLGKL